MNVQQRDILRNLCRRSFYHFVRQHWHTIIPSTPVWNWHIKYLCKVLQKRAKQVHKKVKGMPDLVINVPPGTTKSTIVSEMFPAWVWTWFPEAQFICGSHAAPVAYDLAGRNLRIIKSDLYRALFGQDIVTTDGEVVQVGVILRTETPSMFYNTKEGFRLAIGSGSPIGFHGHFILIDDPVNPNEVDSEAERENAINWMTGNLSSRKIDKEVTATVCVMQRLAQADPSGLMLDELPDRKWGTPVLHICLPWKVSDKVSPAKMKEKYDKTTGLLDPVRITEEVGQAFMIKFGTRMFGSQFGQDPRPRDGAMFKVHLIRYAVPPMEADWVKVGRYWDKAGTYLGGKRTAGVKMVRDNLKRVWVMDVKKGQWSAREREQIIKKTAFLDGRRCRIGVEQEPGSGGKESAENTVIENPGYSVRVDRPSGDKETRAESFAAMMEAGNVYIPLDAQGKSPPWVGDYVDELSYFPGGLFSDQVDGSSGCFNFLIGGPTITVGGMVLTAKAEQSEKLKANLKNFQENRRSYSP
jgi:predicted phage terminase large subunit-like protein